MNRDASPDAELLLRQPKQVANGGKDVQGERVQHEDSGHGDCHRSLGRTDHRADRGDC